MPWQGSLGGIGWCLELAWGSLMGSGDVGDARSTRGPGWHLVLSHGSQAAFAAVSPAFELAES